jgi:hypothetical protein
MMRDYHESNGIPFDEVCDAVRPQLRHDVDIGDGVGGLNTIINLIYSALVLQEEDYHRQNEEKEKKQKKHRKTTSHGSSVHKKDLTDLK